MGSRRAVLQFKQPDKPAKPPTVVQAANP